jgi:hypothetical protein
LHRWLACCNEPRIVKISISHSEPISLSIGHCHASRFSIGNQPTIYSNRLVSSLLVVVINKAFVSAQGPATTS